MTPASAISLGTLTIIVFLFAVHVRSFIKGGKDPKILLSGLGGMLVGSSLAICTGGALGSIAMYIVGGGNSVSGIAPWLSGTSDQQIAPGSAQGLTGPGGLVTVVVVGLGWLCIRDAAKTQRLRLLGGLFCGACLTYTGGYGGLVQSTQIPILNTIGDQIIALVQGQF